MNTKRILALDVGDARIGVAVSDALGLTAQGVGIIENKNFTYVLSQVQKYLSEYECSLLVVGNPLNMDGTRGRRSERTEDFVSELKEHISVPIVMHDERLSTKEAERALEMMGVNWRKQKKSVDIMAAQIILRSYMDTKLL